MASRDFPGASAINEDDCISRALRWRRWRRHPVRHGFLVALIIVMLPMFPIGGYSMYMSGETTLVGALTLSVPATGCVLFAAWAWLRPQVRTPRRMRFSSVGVRQPVLVRWGAVRRLQIRRLGPTGRVICLAGWTSESKQTLFVPSGANLAAVESIIEWAAPPELDYLATPRHAYDSAAGRPAKRIRFTEPWPIHWRRRRQLAMRGSSRLMVLSAIIVAAAFALAIVIAGPAASEYLRESGHIYVLTLPLIVAMPFAVWADFLLRRYLHIGSRLADYRVLNVRRCRLNRGRNVVCIRTWTVDVAGTSLGRRAYVMPTNVNVCLLDAWINYINAESARKRRAYGWERTS